MALPEDRFNREFPLPHMDMDASSAEQQPTPEQEIREIFETKLPKVISHYVDLLGGDSPHHFRKELAKISEDELKAHISQLELLSGVLKEFARDPLGFEVRRNELSKDERSYRVRLKPPSAGDIGESIETAQTQLSFYARVTTTGEGRDRVIEANSLRGLSPDQALKLANRQFYGGQIMVNTLGVMRSGGRYGEIVVIPRGGIELIKEGQYVDVNGLKPVGTHFHRLPVDNEDDLLLGDYMTLHDMVAQMATRGH